MSVEFIRIETMAFYVVRPWFDFNINVLAFHLGIYMLSVKLLLKIIDPFPKQMGKCVDDFDVECSEMNWDERRSQFQFWNIN